MKPTHREIEDQQTAAEERFGTAILVVVSAFAVASLIAWAAAEWCNVPRVEGREREGWAP